MSQESSIKHLFNYVYRDCDLITKQMEQREQHYDEIGHFQDAQYVSALGATSRLSQLEIIGIHATVVRPDARGENLFPVYFEE